MWSSRKFPTLHRKQPELDVNKCICMCLFPLSLRSAQVKILPRPECSESHTVLVALFFCIVFIFFYNFLPSGNESVFLVDKSPVGSVGATSSSS